MNKVFFVHTSWKTYWKFVAQRIAKRKKNCPVKKNEECGHTTIYTYIHLYTDMHTYTDNKEYLSPLSQPEYLWQKIVTPPFFQLPWSIVVLFRVTYFLIRIITIGIAVTHMKDKDFRSWNPSKALFLIFLKFSCKGQKKDKLQIFS